MMDLSGLLKPTALGVKEKIMALFKVSTLVQFKHDYFVEAECLEHAYDEVTMINSGTEADYFEPASQEFLGETIFSGGEFAYDEFEDFLETARKENDLNCSYWMGDKLIRVIQYDEPVVKPEWEGRDTITIRAYNNEFEFSQQDNMNSAGHEVFKQMGTSLILGQPDIGKPGHKEELRYGRTASNRGY